MDIYLWALQVNWFSGRAGKYQCLGGRAWVEAWGQSSRGRRWTAGGCPFPGSTESYPMKKQALALWNSVSTLWEQRPQMGFVSFILGAKEIGVGMEKDLWFMQASHVPPVCIDCRGGSSTVPTALLLHAWSELTGLCMVIQFVWLSQQSL